MKTAVFLLLTMLLLTLPSQTAAQFTSALLQAGGQGNAETESATAKEKGVEKGNETLVTYSQTVTISNLDPIMNPSYNADCGAARYLFYGDDCRIRQYGSIQLVGSDNYRVLARYTEPANIYEVSPKGLCPSGTLFFMSKWEFERMEESYDETLAAKENEEEEKRKIKRLLEDE